MESNTMKAFKEQYKRRDYLFITCDTDGSVEATPYSKEEMEAVLNNPDFLAGKWRWNRDIDDVGLLPGHCYVIKGYQVTIGEKPQPKVWELQEREET